MKKVLIISLTPVASEPRVIRQAEYFLSKKYEVLIAGLRGKDKLDERWKFIDLSDCLENRSRKKKFRAALRLLSFFPRIADHCYWKNIIFERILSILVQYKSSLIISHDYFTAPLGWKLHKIFKCHYIVDSHEHALSQTKSQCFFKNLEWFLLVRGYVHGLQKKYLPKAKRVITVCDGIGESLEKDYGLVPKPLVIRNVPFYTPQAFNKVTSKQKNIQLLYHGLISPGRGLEEIIRALPDCKDYFLLKIRGGGVASYIQNLIHLAKQLKISDRIIFEKPAPFNLIVPKANQSDIGIFVMRNISLQKKYTLPNKFFEYIMAGLALCVSDLPEMAKIVRQYDLGLLVPGAEPKKIAEVLNSLDIEKINYYKQQSLKAAKELCWEVESQKLDYFLKNSEL